MSPKSSLGFPWAAPAKPKNAPPSLKENAAADIQWSRSYTARLARVAILEAGWRPIVKTFAKPSRLGLERLSDLNKKTPVIFTANHRSHADTPILLTSIPNPWRHKLVVGAAKDYFFSSRLKGGFFALTIGAIPIERTKVDRSSADLAAQLIKQGWSLLIYPEGKRSPDGWSHEFRAGAAYLASRHNIPVVPIYLEGTRSILPKGRYFPAASKAQVNFGSPLFPSDQTNTRKFAQEISDATDALADELSSNWWLARQRAHKNETPTTLGPQASSWRRSWSLPVRKGLNRPTAKNPWPKHYSR